MICLKEILEEQKFQKTNEGPYSLAGGVVRILGHKKLSYSQFVLISIRLDLLIVQW